MEVNHWSYFELRKDDHKSSVRLWACRLKLTLLWWHCTVSFDWLCYEGLVMNLVIILLLASWEKTNVIKNDILLTREGDLSSAKQFGDEWNFDVGTKTLHHNAKVNIRRAAIFLKTSSAFSSDVIWQQEYKGKSWKPAKLGRNMSNPIVSTILVMD